MIHPNTKLQFINDQIGYGVFATTLISTGTIVYVEDPLDIVIPANSSPLQNPLLRPLIDKYAVIEPGERRVLAWDISRYVNHCCQPNVISTGYGFEIALRDIQPGEEITDEYSLFNLGWDMPLLCQHSNCRGRLHPDDFGKYYETWDVQIQAALKRVLDVPQPLWPLLDAETAVAIQQVAHTGEGYKSVRALWVAPTAVSPFTRSLAEG